MAATYFYQPQAATTWPQSINVPKQPADVTPRLYSRGMAIRSRTRDSGSHPADRLGEPVPQAPFADPAAWHRLCSQVVIIPGGCHIWIGKPRDDGYAQFWAPSTALHTNGDDVLVTDNQLALEPSRPRVWRAHRFAYSALTGVPLDETMHLMHQCDEPLCVPITLEQLDQHILAGTNAANVADRETKNRGTRRGRYGLPIWSMADRRGQHARSLALHEALTTAIAAGLSRYELATVISEVTAAGNATGQLTLEFPQ